MDRDWTGNRHSVFGILGARNECAHERADNDYYATDPTAVEWLMKLENLNHNIWECACGEGHLAKPLIEAGHDVLCTDLVDRGFGTGGINFLEQTGTFDGDIVTNPPYRYAREFIDKALQLVTDGNRVCMFLKVQFLEGKSRRSLYESTPPHGLRQLVTHTVRKERRVRTVNGRLCVVRMGEGIRRGYCAEMVQLTTEGRND